MESGSQNSVPVAVDITAVYGRNAKPGSFDAHKGQHLRPDGGTVFGTLTVSTLESDNDEGTEEYEYSYQVEVGPAETKTMEFYVPLGQKSGTIHLTLKDGKKKTMGEHLHGFLTFLRTKTVCLQVSWRTSQEVFHGLTGLG